MCKRSIFLSLIVILMLSLCLTNINAKTLEIDANLFNSNNSDFVPLKDVFEGLGWNYNFSYKTGDIKIIKDKTTIDLKLGSQKAYKNGNLIDLSFAPQIINNQIFVPQSFIIDALNYDINLIDNKMIISNELKVHFIDVGQADSILIQTPSGLNMLIDAGETKSGAILAYLKGLNINRLDYVVATHPHEDHISEMHRIIDNFDIGKFYMPNVGNWTVEYKNMIKSLNNKGIKSLEAKAFVNLNLGSNIRCEIISPSSNNYGDNLNNWSAVIRLSYGNTSFLFTGDAEALAEKEMINNKFNLKSTVLKVSHHGDRNATCDEFLQAVKPSIAIISAPESSVWGHPHQEVMERLIKNNILIYQTSKSGNIVLTSDSKNISISTSK